MTNLFDAIYSLKKEYDERREMHNFSIITALHRERDETNLHSRFISYLLSATSNHGLKNTYAKILFKDILGVSEFDFSNYQVFPNELDKKEYKFIDILLVNKKKSQAIIIENKIDAKDSNNDTKINGYKGQLERYYNTIKKVADKDGEPCNEYKCENVLVYYLSNGTKPSDISVGILKDIPSSWKSENVISYENEVREWLKRCIDVTSETKPVLRELIQHYLDLINKMTHSDLPIAEILELKDIVSNNIAQTSYLIENFKHIKWHTIHQFWVELGKKLQTKGFHSVSYYVEYEVTLEANGAKFKNCITQVTHEKKSINYGIHFDFISGEKAYISGLGSLSWGIFEPQRWAIFENPELENINFLEFSSVNTYQLIDEQDMIRAIELIVDEIIKKDFNILNH
ncbi:PD-(D/E)XK nuclease family protein [Flavobacterium psychrotrophum]|uniref:PDDEXK-like family protein n=1 Tax=Flavobacterium psychrotrophum TaxID=2294119 RepID=UPI0013C40052|nr:PD-(D/E)XK nuclease family protein [Flavobacterium psychrotrophum]